MPAPSESEVCKQCGQTKSKKVKDSKRDGDWPSTPCSLLEFFVWVVPRLVTGSAEAYDDYTENCRMSLLGLIKGYNTWIKDQSCQIDVEPTYEAISRLLEISKEQKP